MKSQLIDQPGCSARGLRKSSWALVFLGVVTWPFLIVGCDSSGSSPDGKGEKTAHFPMRSEGPKTLDPVLGSTVYDNRCCSQIIETLVQYKYLKRPYELEPLLLEEMPTEVETTPEMMWREFPSVAWSLLMPTLLRTTPPVMSKREMGWSVPAKLFSAESSSS